MSSGPPPYGLGLSLRLGSAAVRSVFPGSPADDAGLETWEVIEKIDGVYTRGRPLWQIALELNDRWADGDTVTLTVVDRQVDARRELALVPGEWQHGNARHEDLTDARLVRIDSLAAGAAEEIGAMVETDAPLVLDLRGLVWGLEHEAIAVADLFIEEGVLARWRGRQAEGLTVEATEGAQGSLPIVLIDRETEGAGEVLAAALQRSGALLVGQQTMGHAPHMDVVHRGELSLWIPVGRWLDPADEPINGDGLIPNEEVDDPDEDDDGDPILDRALGLLRAAAEQAA
jgi:carboxyl-terminal processing protease